MDFKNYRLNSRVIQDLKKRSAVGIVFYIITLWVILFSYRYFDRHPEFSGIFLYLMIGICLVRFLHLLAGRWVPNKFEKIDYGIFFFSIGLTALIWGIGHTMFMIQEGESDTKLLMLVCTTGLCSGGAVAYIPDIRLSVLFSFLMFAPSISTLIFYHINISLAVVTFFYLIYLWLIAHRGNREYWGSLKNEYLLKEKSIELEKMSRVDGLTGLYNRRHFDEVFTFEWYKSARNQTALSLVLCDIDHFKKINDKHGHLAGDEYLKAVARMIRYLFKRKIDITARFGGEEFIILLVDEQCKNACELAEMLRAMVQVFSLEYEGIAIRTTISLGVSTYIPKPNDKPEVMILEADKALYQSKTTGRNKVSQNIKKP